MDATFIGIDLAWAPKNGTGVAVLVPRGRGRLAVAAAEVVRTDQEIASLVAAHLARTTVITVDAPLVIPNATGMRECDKQTHVLFGRHHTGCYPANRGNMGRYTGGVPRGEALGGHLERLGFHWPPGALPEPPLDGGRWLFECYPHPAQVVLFGLATTLKYKRKRQGWTQARAEFRRYLRHCLELRSPSIAFPPALLLRLDVRSMVGAAYKQREDMLDAIFCAYLAALMPQGRLHMLGQPEEGSIIVPRRQLVASRD